MKKTSNPVKMFALVNCGIIKNVSHLRRDCVAFGRECFRDATEYDKYIRKGWFKVVPCEVILPSSAGDRSDE